VSVPTGTRAFLTDAEVAALVPMPLAVDALADAFRDEAEGTAQTLQRTRVSWEGGRVQALGGYLGARGCAAVKSWVATPNGAQPTLLLFSAVDGGLLAIMAAAELGRIRTGAASAVATRALAREDASVLLVVGSGRQARTQVAGALCVRPIERVLVAARDAGKTARFAAELRERFGVACEAVESVEAGAAEADIVTTVTNAVEPVLRREWLRPGTHVNAVGAIVPWAVEVDPAIFAAAAVLAVDSPAQAAEESAELREAVDRHGLRPSEVRPLHEVLSARRRRDPDAITVFKSLGVGLEDAAVAELAWRRSTG
jgi:ornithine cyclodeaminase